MRKAGREPEEGDGGGQGEALHIDLNQGGGSPLNNSTCEKTEMAAKLYLMGQSTTPSLTASPISQGLLEAS